MWAESKKFKLKLFLLLSSSTEKVVRGRYGREGKGFLKGGTGQFLFVVP